MAAECCQRATGGRGTAETEGPCRDSVKSTIRPGLLSKQSGGHSHRKGATTCPPGASVCRCRGGESQQDGGAQIAGSLDKNMQQRKISWPDLWRADSYHISFLVQAVNDALLSPANIHTRGKSETPACPLCAGRGSLQHLSSCPKALADGCYCWRHNQVRKAVAEAGTSAILSSRHRPRENLLPKGWRETPFLPKNECR